MEWNGKRSNRAKKSYKYAWNGHLHFNLQYFCDRIWHFFFVALCSESEFKDFFPLFFRLFVDFSSLSNFSTSHISMSSALSWNAFYVQNVCVCGFFFSVYSFSSHFQLRIHHVCSWVNANVILHFKCFSGFNHCLFLSFTYFSLFIIILMVFAIWFFFLGKGTWLPYVTF